MLAPYRRQAGNRLSLIILICLSWQSSYQWLNPNGNGCIIVGRWLCKVCNYLWVLFICQCRMPFSLLTGFVLRMSAELGHVAQDSGWSGKEYLASAHRNVSNSSAPGFRISELMAKFEAGTVRLKYTTERWVCVNSVIIEHLNSSTPASRPIQFDFELWVTSVKTVILAKQRSA
jgi:hypothetical protein